MNGDPFLVLGSGRSGSAAAAALRRRGASVRMVERATEEAVRAWAAEGAGGGTVVASPGIPPADPALRAARALGLRVRGELSLGCELLPEGARVVAVTGSKGKSSLVKFLADALAASGRRAVPCGNYGLPVCAAADADPPIQDAIVECSSFQLETADEALRPDVAILLNLSRDHLDRHGSMEAYREAKLALFRYAAPGALALLPAPPEDPAGLADAFRARYPGKAFSTFGAGPDADFRFAVPAGSYFDNDVLRPAAAAGAAALLRLGLSKGAVREALAGFEPLPHRMQTVARRGAVEWIDNSKATSLAALAASLRMARAPIFLVAGGRLKEPFSLPANLLLDSGVEKVYAFGECGPEMSRVWSEALPAPCFSGLPEACAAAAADAARIPSGTVLLAPGTASFDQFGSYAERGDLFATLARRFCAAGPAIPPDPHPQNSPSRPIP